MKIKSILALALTFILSASIAWAGDASPASSASPTATPKASDTHKPSDPFEVQIVKEVDLKKDAIYDATLQWLAETFVSSKSVIEFQDKGSGKIIGNIRVEIQMHDPIFGAAWTANAKATQKIEIKDGKFRMSFSNIYVEDLNLSVTYGDRYSGDTSMSESRKAVTKSFNELADSLQAYLLKSKESNF